MFLVELYNFLYPISQTLLSIWGSVQGTITGLFLFAKLIWYIMDF